MAATTVLPEPTSPWSRRLIARSRARSSKIAERTRCWPPVRANGSWRRNSASSGQAISSAGLGKPETLKDGGLGQGNVWIVQDLLEAIDKDRQPRGNIYDGRAALEMILAVYESFRLRGPVDLPLKNRRHPLGLV